MLKSIILFSSVILLFSCKGKMNTKVSEEEKTTENRMEKIAEIDSKEAENWLIKSIEKFFKEEQSYAIFTKEYVDYKADATSVGYDDGLTEAGFNKKWGTKFNTKYAGLGVGFLISAQDWNEILVKKCKFKKQKDGILYFDVILTDIEFKDEEYKREIHVERKNKQFLIADVLELN